jgi:predicted nuclease of restriction endonuclease-like (RecB) superfamily
MRAFYLAYAKVAQAVRFLNELSIARIPWGHNILLIEKIKNVNERLWYAEQTIREGLSRNALEDSITSKALNKQSCYALHKTY